MPSHPKTVNIEGFKGINNVLPPERTPVEYLKEALNVDIDKSGGVHKRLGYTKVIEGVFHSLWDDEQDAYVVKDGDLVKLNTDYSTTTLLASVGTDKISYAQADGKIYFSSISVKGVIENGSVRDWGIERMNPLPVVSTGSGLLTAGTYQIACTYVASDGRESGVGRAQVVEVSNNSSIILSSIPTSPESQVDRVRIYCTTPNGEILYFAKSIANGTSTVTIADTRDFITPLKSFGYNTPPQGHIVRYSHGRILVADDNVLWFSEPYSYEWFNYQTNFIQFESRIRAVMPVEGGVWVAADKLYYFAGKNIATASSEMKEPIKVVEGSDVRIPGAYIFIENTPIGYKWLFTADKGIYVAFNDGMCLNMTAQNVELPLTAEGTGAFIQKDGINRYLSLLKNPLDSENTRVGDVVTATIIRNGVAVTE